MHGRSSVCWTKSSSSYPMTASQKCIISEFGKENTSTSIDTFIICGKPRPAQLFFNARKPCRTRQSKTPSFCHQSDNELWRVMGWGNKANEILVWSIQPQCCCFSRTYECNSSPCRACLFLISESKQRVARILLRAARGNKGVWAQREIAGASGLQIFNKPTQTVKPSAVRLTCIQRHEWPRLTLPVGHCLRRCVLTHHFELRGRSRHHSLRHCLSEQTFTPIFQKE